MANRFILNETSYHGSGAILAIADEAKARGYKKHSYAQTQILLNLALQRKY